MAWRRGAILALWGWRAILALSWWGTSVLTRRWAAVLAWRSTVLAWRCAISTRCLVVGLLVLGVVATVNGAKKKLDDPQIRCEIHRRIGAHHLFLLVLEVRGAVNLWSDYGVLIKFTEELPSSFIISNLSELKCNSAAAILWETLKSVKSILNGIEDGVLGLSSWLTIGDGNDQYRLVQLTVPRLLENDAINDLLSHSSSHRCKTLELYATHNLLNLSFRGHTILERTALLVACVGKISVHEAKRNTIMVKERGSKRDPLQNKAQVLDAASLLFKLHGTTVVDIEYNVVQGKLDNIICDFLCDTPALNDLVDLGACLLSDLGNPWVIWRVEALEVLLLDTGIEKLLVAFYFSRAALG